MSTLSKARNLIAPILFPLCAAATVHAGSATPEMVAAQDLYLPGEIVVRLESDGDMAGLAGLNARLGVRGIERLFPKGPPSLRSIYRLTVDPDRDIWHAALQYADHAGVVYAEPNLRARLAAPVNDPLLSTQYNLHNVGQTGGFADADVDGLEAGRFYVANPPAYAPVLAVLDTGVDLGHPDLINRLLDGYDFLGDDADPSDTDGHGTGTTSIAAAEANNGEGIVGLCPNCWVRPVRVGSWVVHFGSVEVAEGITYAADPAQGGADVMSMSLGGTCSDLWTDAVDYAHDQDVLMVAAAGNATIVVVYPAAYPRVVSVGATDEYDEVPIWVPVIGTIDVHAPGVAVPVADRFSAYDRMTGTSAATPHVAATAGLLWGQNPALSAIEVRQIIIDTADDKGSFLFPYTRLNAHQAILSAQTPPATPYDPPHEGCSVIPLSLAERGAVERVIAYADASVDGLGLARLLHRHRIQLGALITANPPLAALVSDVVDGARANPADWRALLGLLQAVYPYASADLRADLTPALAELAAR